MIVTNKFQLLAQIYARLERLGEDPDQFCYSIMSDDFVRFMAGRSVLVVCDRNDTLPRTVMLTTDMNLGRVLERMGRL